MLSLRYDAFCRSQRRAVFGEGQRVWRAMKRISVFCIKHIFFYFICPTGKFVPFYIPSFLMPEKSFEIHRRFFFFVWISFAFFAKGDYNCVILFTKE